MISAHIFKPSSSEALFRYLVVSQVQSLMHQGYSRSRAVREVASRKQFTLEGKGGRVSERTLHRWTKAFLVDRRMGLEPCSRPRPGTLVLSKELLSYCTAQKTIDQRASIPELIRRARRYGVIKEHQKVSRTTVYRALKRAGVAVHRRKSEPHDDKRRFAYEHRMQMMLCDGKHFRVGVERQRRVALFFLDDATRYGLDVVVGTSETSRMFLEGLHAVIRQYGLPSLLYLDQGPGFRALDTAQVVLQLGACLIHGEAAYAEGRGKIERFNQTALHALLRSLDRRPDVDPGCKAVRLRLRHWLKKIYNTTPHEGIARNTPFDSFHNDTTPLRFPDSEQKLDNMFMITFKRTVTADNIVSVDSCAYDMPKGYSRERVILYRRVLSDTIHFLHQERLIELHPVDTALNARSKRGQEQTDEEPAHPPPPSAADMSFSRDYKTLLGPDGGFRDPASNTDTPSSEE